MRFSMTLLCTLLLVTTACRGRGDTRKSGSTPPNTAPAVVVAPTFDHNKDFKKGNPQAPLTLEYFADLQCGACKQLSPIVAQLQVKYPDKILWVFKNYPKDNSCMVYTGEYEHEYSCESAAAARCVGLYKDKFWEMKDRIFANQTATNLKSLKDWSIGFGMSAQDYDTCVASAEIMNKVKADITEAQARGVVGTPTVFINNVKVYPATQAKLEAEIEKQLK